ncbi:MAG: type IV secretory system conjugative DNA transfer family protein, partial [Bacteroidota bacterium]
MDLGTIILAAIIIGGVMIIAVLGSFTRKDSDRFGSAKLEKNRRFYSRYNKGLPINGRNRISRKASMRHVAVLGPTGAGKSMVFYSGAILLALGSKVVTDVKGTLYKLFSGVLKYVLGYKVLLIDVMDISRSLRYNDLQELKNESDARKWADAAYGMHNSSERTEGIWKRGATQCIEIILICLMRMKKPKYLTVANLINLVGKLGSQEGCKELEGFIATYGRDGNDTSIIQAFEHYRQQETKIMSGQHS